MTPAVECSIHLLWILGIHPMTTPKVTSVFLAHKKLKTGLNLGGR